MRGAVAFAVGLLMVAACAVHGDGAAVIAAAVAAIAVVVGLLVSGAATVAVVAAAVALALSEPSPWIAALAGLAAAAYLVLRHARGGGAVTVPTVLGAVGLSAVTLAGAAVPLGLPWVPLLAPLAVVVVYALALAPLHG